MHPKRNISVIDCGNTRERMGEGGGQKPKESSKELDSGSWNWVGFFAG